MTLNSLETKTTCYTSLHFMTSPALMAKFEQVISKKMTSSTYVAVSWLIDVTLTITWRNWIPDPSRGFLMPLYCRFAGHRGKGKQHKPRCFWKNYTYLFLQGVQIQFTNAEVETPKENGRRSAAGGAQNKDSQNPELCTTEGKGKK